MPAASIRVMLSRVCVPSALPYYNPVRDQVLQYIREEGLIRAGDRIAVAVSGGADSVALLRVLFELKAELGVVLSMAHFNHRLRGEQSDADEAFVAELAKETGLDFFVGHGDVREHANISKLSIEAAARQLRYRWFADLAREQRLGAIATAHTVDDQAETVLLKFLRGAGTRGLAGIYPARKLGTENAYVVRPLLSITRREVETYLTDIGQQWREDDSNLDRRFLRNRVRHELLPVLEREFNPNVRSVLSDLANIARGEETYWQASVDRELLERTTRQSGEGEHVASPAGPLFRLDGFAGLPLAIQRRLLKAFAHENGLALDFQSVERLRVCALGNITRVELPGGVCASVKGSLLGLGQIQQSSACSYTCVLPIPGEVWVPEAGFRVRAYIVKPEFAQRAVPGSLLNLGLVGPQLTVRSWQPGDRFWPAYSRSEEKLKRLFLEKKIPAGERSGWPVGVCEGRIIWVRGFCVATTHQWRGEGEALQIEVLEA